MKPEDKIEKTRRYGLPGFVEDCHASFGIDSMVLGRTEEVQGVSAYLSFYLHSDHPKFKEILSIAREEGDVTVEDLKRVIELLETEP